MAWRRAGDDDMGPRAGDEEDVVCLNQVTLEEYHQVVNCGMVPGGCFALSEGNT